MLTKPPPPPTEPGDALDAWLAEWLMGWQIVHHRGDDWWCDDKLPHFLVRNWRPSTSTAIALDEVAEAMRKHGYGRQTVASPHVTTTYVQFNHHKHLNWYSKAVVEPEAAAVCLAASQARYVELTAEAAKEEP